jgi:hypothetical protein
MNRILARSAVLLLLTCAGASAWGPEGHRTIATLALAHLEKHNPAAAARVKEILEGESIQDASIWPDDVRPNRIASRSGRFANTEEGRAFNTAHPDNPKWHYVDLPLASKGYGTDKRFIAENDIVATQEKCIDVLEGRSEFMNKHDALRYLVHLAGDVHQPLHAAIGFFRFDGEGRATLITDPDEAAANMKGGDSGGNKLLLEKNLPLHRYWDENLVALNAKTEAGLAVKLRDRVAAFKPANAGAVRSWPAQWATDSIGVSRELYSELKFGKRFPRTGGYWTLYLNFEKGTKEKFTAMAGEQLVKAARNLAETLGAIQWAR